MNSPPAPRAARGRNFFFALGAEQKKGKCAYMNRKPVEKWITYDNRRRESSALDLRNHSVPRGLAICGT